MTHGHNAITHTLGSYSDARGGIRYTFIIFGLYTKPNLCPPPLAQNSGDATDLEYSSIYMKYFLHHNSWQREMRDCNAPYIQSP